jgi:hypothetical protein
VGPFKDKKKKMKAIIAQFEDMVGEGLIEEAVGGV